MDAATITALIAEDDVLVSDVIEEELGRVGISVVGRAFDGRQAVEQACRLQPDVVLMDIQMPEMTGIEAARELRERNPLPIVVLSVHTEKEMLREATEAGVGAYATKPPQALDLLRAITVARARFSYAVELRRRGAHARRAPTPATT